MSAINPHDQKALLTLFKAYLVAEDTSRNTMSAYLSDLADFFSWYGQANETLAIDEVTPTDIRDYREALQEQASRIAPATINRRLAALRRFFAWAREHHLIPAVPTERIRNVESTVHGSKSLVLPRFPC